jgi:hypothetical protein
MRHLEQEEAERRTAEWLIRLGKVLHWRWLKMRGVYMWSRSIQRRLPLKGS